MMLKIALALFLALLGFPAWALSPSYSGGGGGEGAGHFLSSTVSGAGAAFNVSAGELIRVPVFVEIGTTGTAPAIIAVTNDVTPLAWRRRAFVTGTVGENSGGGVTVCTGNFELWEAYSPSAITATHVSVKISAPSDSTAWYVNRYANTWGAARPSDGNTSLPVAVSNNAGAGAAPTATIPATSQADDLIVGYAAYCASELANSGAAGYTANNSYQDGGGNYNQQGAISKSVSSPQSTLAVTFGGGISAPAGFFMIADALTNDAPPPKSQATSASVATDITVTGGGGLIPAPAVAAGFTTLVLDADFSQPAYSNIANWVDGCGGPTSGFRWVANGVPSCSRIIMEVDGSIGQQVLHTQATPADGMAPQLINYPNGYFGYPNTTSYFPLPVYWEATFRVRSGSLTQNGQVNMVSSWFPVGTGNTQWFEPDNFEVLSNTNTGSGWQWGDGSLEWCGGTICGSLSGVPAGGYSDLTVYHKVGILFTSDGSRLVKCNFLDGNLLPGGCYSYTPINPGILSHHDFSVNIAWGNWNQVSGGVINDIDAYWQYERLYYCPSWTTTSCFGTIVDHWPFP